MTPMLKSQGSGRQVFSVALEVLPNVFPDASLYFLPCIFCSSFQVSRKQPRCPVPDVCAHIRISKWNDFLPFLFLMTSFLHFFCESFLIPLMTFICQLLYIILYHNCISVFEGRICFLVYGWYFIIVL